MLLVQKSILRDATTDLSLHFLVRGAWGGDPQLVQAAHLTGTQLTLATQADWLACISCSTLARPASRANGALRAQAKAKILVVRDIERDDIEFISKTLGCLPIADVESMRPEKLGHAALVTECSVRCPALWLFHPCTCASGAGQAMATRPGH